MRLVTGVLIVLVLFALSCTSDISSAAEEQKTVALSMSRDEFAVESSGGYDLIRLRRSFSADEPGWPLIPSRHMSIVLPQGAQISDVATSNEEWTELSGTYLLYPVQPPRPLSQDELEMVEPSEGVYSLDGPLPAHPVRNARMGDAGGFRVASVVVTPFRYWPSTGRVEFMSLADIVIEYAVSGSPATHLTEFQIDETSKALRSTVVNPEDVCLFAPLPTGVRTQAPMGGIDEYRHVLITSADLAPYLDPVSAWRTKHGFPSMIMTVEDIVMTYPGWDDAERVRNFIIDAHDSWGTLYFTLAGDMGVVPVRYMGDPASGPSGSAPVDLYFSDLDGTWDANENHIYGEEADSVDLYSDVYVGRASIETMAEAHTFVTKTLTYEKSPPAGYIESCLLPAVQLWQNYYGAFVNDSIAAVTPTPPWNDIKLYDRDGTISRQLVIDAINNGAGFCHYSAHGNQNGVYFAGGDTVLHSTDALALINGDMLGIHNSIACISGAFDGGEILGDCFAEHLVNNPNGGAVACIMNSRVGLGTPPDMGPSEHLSLEFYHKTFDEGMHRIGMAHGISKDAWLGTGFWAYDFCVAELNLFGDAALLTWTSEPRVQVVEHPETAPLGNSLFTVTVTSDGTPLEGALVCIMSAGGEVYDYDETDAAGQISFSMNPGEEDTLHVTSVAPNHIPYEGTSLIEGDQSGISGGTEAGAGTWFRVVSNPVRETARFRFDLEAQGPVAIKVFDVSGRLVKDIVSGHHTGGVQGAEWDGLDVSRQKVAPGVYFVTFRSSDLRVQRRLVVLQ